VCAGLVRGGARCVAALLSSCRVRHHGTVGPKRRWGCFGANQAIKAYGDPHQGNQITNSNYLSFLMQFPCNFLPS